MGLNLGSRVSAISALELDVISSSVICRDPNCVTMSRNTSGT